ncbi:hypothetical protein FE257_006990 [Aspergillus nanangensis]|uniref:Uncharacterized protein n=1 Tax=Aspergillus nanangensis TaxID=2582783 RepID=A0AAD4CNA8_ASPNN|nr:hypothetical protein FE257_006990 [Aspergillus nanangensis]
MHCHESLLTLLYPSTNFMSNKSHGTRLLPSFNEPQAQVQFPEPSSPDSGMIVPSCYLLLGRSSIWKPGTGIFELQNESPTNTGDHNPSILSLELMLTLTSVHPEGNKTLCTTKLEELVSNNSNKLEQQRPRTTFPKHEPPVRRDDSQMKSHHQKRKAKELHFFYITCILLGSLVGLTAILFVLRWGFARFFRTRTSFLGRPTTRGMQQPSMGSSRGPPIPDLTELDSREQASLVGVTGDDEAVEMRGPVARVFAPSTKPSRRRIQDVFDLESLGSRGRGGRSEERILVLPQAPNASIRRQQLSKEAQC